MNIDTETDPYVPRYLVAREPPAPDPDDWLLYGDQPNPAPADPLRDVVTVRIDSGIGWL